MRGAGQGTRIFLVRVEPEKNVNRWYNVVVQPTLLDPWAVICAWGRRDSSYQRVRVLPVESLLAAETLANKVVAQKLSRGYSAVSD